MSSASLNVLDYPCRRRHMFMFCFYVLVLSGFKGIFLAHALLRLCSITPAVNGRGFLLFFVALHFELIWRILVSHAWLQMDSPTPAVNDRGSSSFIFLL